MSILVTGASGFIGTKIINHCLTKNEKKVVGIGRKEIRTDIEWYRADITDRKKITEIFHAVKPTHILHLASKGVTRDESTLKDLLLNNTVGTDNILFAASSLHEKPNVIILGTAYEYESSNIPLKENSTLQPKSPYAISKTASAYCIEKYKGKLIAHYLRLFNIYGPGEPSDRLIPYIVDCAIKGKEIKLTGCLQLRDFMYIDDLVNILYAFLTKPLVAAKESQVFNVGTGNAVQLKDLVLKIKSNLELRGIRSNIAFDALPYRADDPMTCVANNTKLLNALGGFNFTEVNEGIEKTLDCLI